MKVYIVIPVHNEEKVLNQCLKSLVDQTLLPDQLILVNDNSSDGSIEIIQNYTQSFDWIKCVEQVSSEEHLPGTKVVNAFNKGLSALDLDFDVICKFDADIIFPANYISELIKMFNEDPKLGVAGGLPFVQKNGEWVFENIASKDHVRGPVKAYRKQCFKDIDGLRPTVGWDTLDVLLAGYFGWKVSTNKQLIVKHLKPTGMAYNKTAKFMQGKAFFGMRYGLVLTSIAALKGAWVRKQPLFFAFAFWGFIKSWINKEPFLVTNDQGRYIRKLRWAGIKKKLF